MTIFFNLHPNEGKIVAIDIETGAFEVDENVVPVTNRLFEQYPEAQSWVIRIGHLAVDCFGQGVRRKIHDLRSSKFTTRSNASLGCSPPSAPFLKIFN
jgi:hypothetical protein